MNIANIFGLHLGCKVKDIGMDETGKLKGVIPHSEITGGFYLVYEKENGTYCDETVPITECKLLLKPLPAISEEDKVEFEKEFNVKAGSFTTIAFEELVLMDTREPLMPVLTRYTIQQELFLASRSYDIGIVSDEYKEVLK